jgi:hypothetical protein
MAQGAFELLVFLAAVLLPLLQPTTPATQKARRAIARIFFIALTPKVWINHGDRRGRFAGGNRH